MSKRISFMLFLLSASVSGFAVTQSPQVTVSPLQVVSDDTVTVRGTGFTPNRSVSSHMRRPDQTEYNVLRFVASAQGEYSHVINALLLQPGTHDLWVVDEASGAVSGTVQFTVGFGVSSIPVPEVEKAIALHAGVWSGEGTRHGGSAKTPVLLSMTGVPGAALAGMVAYPSLECGAVLTFRAIDRVEITVAETSVFNAAKCPGNATITLKWSAVETLSFEWRDSESSVTGSAILKRLQK